MKKRFFLIVVATGVCSYISCSAVSGNVKFLRDTIGADIHSRFKKIPDDIVK